MFGGVVGSYRKPRTGTTEVIESDRDVSLPGPPNVIDLCWSFELEYATSSKLFHADLVFLVLTPSYIPETKLLRAPRILGS